MRQSYVYLVSCLLSFSFNVCAKNSKTQEHHADVSWTVVGAGPAGIATIGVLLELGISEKDIVWVDPKFDVGRLGEYYYNVPGNAVTKNYVFFVQQCRVFNEFPSQARDKLFAESDSCEECILGFVVDPLLDITNHLRTKVTSVQDSLVSLKRNEQHEWHLQLNNSSFTSHNVVLATGAQPRKLNYPCKNCISLDLAIDKNKLTQLVDTQSDTIALIGGAHSAILILKYLSEIGVPRIVNFYKHPLRYAYDMGDGNPTHFNGLKGATGRWAYNVLEKNSPAQIARLKNSQEAREAWLPLCNKIIYAIGYTRNPVPLAEGHTSQVDYNSSSGEISSRLFGIGIAFPEQVIEDGKKEAMIGLIDFMLYAQRVAPEWIKKLHSRHIELLNNILTISIL